MPNTIRLRKGEFLRLGREGGTVVQGTAWATVSGNSEDFILHAGEALPCCYRHVLVESLSDDLLIESGRNLLKNIA
jgi:hypothetical protein